MADDIDYKIRKSNRAKNMSIRISNAGEVQVVLPNRMRVKTAHEFVASKKDWIRNVLERISVSENTKIQTGTKIPYLGGYLKIYVSIRDIVYPKANIVSDSLLVQIPESLKNNQKELKRVIENELKKNFRSIVHESLEEYNKFYNYHYNRVAIKDNKTNWGSCSSLKNLNFNWRLVFAPLDIIDYVVVHELCHLKEQNHSQRFWDLVAKKFPDYKEKRKWLRLNGGKLRI